MLRAGKSSSLKVQFLLAFTFWLTGSHTSQALDSSL